MKIAISGSSGFIGKHLVELLKNKENIELILIDLSNNFDLSNSKITEQIDAFDVFIHLAGLSYVPDSYKYPANFYTTNFETTLNALELCRRYKAKMIFISSYVYGNPEYLPIDEGHPLKPFNPYAQSKIIAEKLCEGFNRDFNVPCYILRPFNIYGKGQNPIFLIPSIINAINQKNFMIQLGDPSPRRDFIHVNDVVKAIEACIYNNTIEYELFNIASGQSFSVLEITEIFKEITKCNQIIEFNFDEKLIRKNEVSETRGSFDKINRLLGWKPTITLHDGLINLLSEQRNQQ